MRSGQFSVWDSIHQQRWSLHWGFLPPTLVRQAGSEQPIQGTEEKPRLREWVAGREATYRRIRGQGF